MARRASIGAVFAAAGLALLVVSWAPLMAAPRPPGVWQARAGALAAALVSGTEYAVVGSVIFDQSARKPRGRVALVDARSAREIWAAEYRNSQCCLTPSVGFLPASRRVIASGDELLLVSLRGRPSRRLALDGSTIDVAVGGGQVLVGTLKGEVIAFQAGRELWQARHPDVMAVALSADGLAAAASRQAVAVYDARTGQPLRQIPLTETRAVDLAFFPGALLVVAQKTTPGDLKVLGIDMRSGRLQWSVALGPTTSPTVGIAGRVIVIGDFLGRTAAVVSPSGVVQDRWTDAQGRVFIAGSPRGEIAVAVGPNVAVRTSTGRVRWRGAIPGSVLGLRLDGPWLAAIGTTAQNSYAPDRIWFLRTDLPAPPP